MYKDFIEFLKGSHSVFHCVKTVSDMLEDEGFCCFDPRHDKLLIGKDYYFVKNQSTVIAFRLPERLPTAMRIAASHCDCPGFKLKHGVMNNSANYAVLNTERYGGVVLSSWMDIPLALAGRLIVQNNGLISSELVDTDEGVCIIPSLAPHIKSDRNSLPDASRDMFPLYSCDKNGSVMALLAEKAGVKLDSVLGADVYIYNAMEPTVWDGGRLISSRGLDDLMCVWSSLKGFLSSRGSDRIDMLCIFDNEEVGSGTKQGADSDLISLLCSCIFEAYGMNELEKLSLYSRSLAISADNAHAIHPNHPEANDGVDRPRLNGGLVLKFNANSRYTTDGVSSAAVKKLCLDNDIPLQYYSNRSDLAGGSTLGNLLYRHLPIDCADVGIAQLSMHSSYETAGLKDLVYMSRFFGAFYESDINILF
ncbi:MAG: M18 family aminopeptidase [Ruminococcaceae bacterium]|nr:M18 family aminopeptidase [Oscillospiraceae bacterium]